MYLAFLALIIIPPVFLIGAVVLYVCFRWRKRRRQAIARTGQEAATATTNDEVHQQVEVGLQVEPVVPQIHAIDEDTLEELRWSPADDVRIMHLLSYMNSLLESGNLGEMHTASFIAPFVVTQPPSYDEVVSTQKYKIMEPPSYSSVAHIKPPSFGGVSELSSPENVSSVSIPISYMSEASTSSSMTSSTAKANEISSKNEESSPRSIALTDMHSASSASVADNSSSHSENAITQTIGTTVPTKTARHLSFDDSDAESVAVYEVSPVQPVDIVAVSDVSLGRSDVQQGTSSGSVLPGTQRDISPIDID